MNIGLYSPYIDTLGGGERYVLTLASHWSKHHTVSVFWDDQDIKKKAEERFSLDLSRVQFVHNIFQDTNKVRKLWATRFYDVLFVLTDGSIPTSLARHNILHVQVPFSSIAAGSLKLWRYQSIVCNSTFTKDHIDPRIIDRAVVIYPPVSIGLYKNGGRVRENIILSVGRFSSQYQAKKQEVLIEGFRSLVKDKQCSDWRMVFAGGLLPSDQMYLTQLQKKIGKLPITCMPNISFSDLVVLYQSARYYWHAAGYGETKPEHMEHFGMTTVEAMAAGCIPFSFAGGGQPEIVQHGTDGFLWNTLEELVQYTKQIMSDKKKELRVKQSAVYHSAQFDVSVFVKAYDDLLQRMQS